MANSTCAFTAHLAPSKALLHKPGCAAFTARPSLYVAKRSRKSATIVAASNPVAEVQKTLERTLSGVTGTVKETVAEAAEKAKGLDLRGVILLQGALALMLPVQSKPT